MLSESIGLDGENQPEFLIHIFDLTLKIGLGNAEYTRGQEDAEKDQCFVPARSEVLQYFALVAIQDVPRKFIRLHFVSVAYQSIQITVDKNQEQR